MRIAIIDADLIGRKRHRFPNLACMKLSGYHKDRGDSVALTTKYNDLQQFDHVYVSKVFTDTPIPDAVLTLPNVSYGGTGFFYDKAAPLPDEVEHHMPDYRLYDEWVEEQIRLGKKPKEFACYTDYSIGFLTRGCFRHCPFCVNRGYDRSEPHSPLSEFLDPGRPKICLLDDNFFACSAWRELLAELKRTGKSFQFKQGLDERLLTDEKCEALFSSRLDGDVIFAFDDAADAPLIEEKLKLIRKHTSKVPKFYCFCGYDRSGKWDKDFWRQDIFNLLKRIEILSRYRCLPYVMRFSRYTESPYHGAYITIARWCNQPSFFKKKTLREFIAVNGEKSACFKYLRDFEELFPEVSFYYDMRFGERSAMNNKPLTLGSLFDGSAGFPLGGLLAGIKPVWASEIEPFAVRVTTKRLPFMKHYGDIKQMDGSMIEPVDIITFGSPCQDMSVAGKRDGLDGSRSSLFYEAVRIIKEMREATHGEYPKYIVWENVPGALSSGKPKGADFQSVLTEVCRICDDDVDVPLADKWQNAGEIMGNGYSVAWRVLDAQYWGVPQRRKRIYLVGDLTGGRAGSILFESEGLSGYSAESFRAWQRAAGGLTAGAGTAGTICLNPQGHSGIDITVEKTNALVSQAHGNEPCVMESAGFCTEHSAQSRSIGYEEEVSPTLRAGVVPAAISLEHNPSDGRLKIIGRDVSQTLCGRMGTGGNNVPLLMSDVTRDKVGALQASGYEKLGTQEAVNGMYVIQPKVYGICADKSNSMLSDNPNSGIYEAETTRTLDGNGGNPACHQGGMIVLEGNGSRPSHLGDGYAESETMYTLNATEHHGVAYGLTTGSFMQTTEDTARP